MKCPKCDITLPDSTEVCPLCHTQIKSGADNEETKQPVSQDTSRFAAIDPSKDTYDFDLQYTLTFKDAGEIRQAIADMEIDIGKDRSEELLHPERAGKKDAERPERRQRTQAEMEEAAQRAELRREQRSRESKRKFALPALHNRTEKVSRSEREKAAALRAAKTKRERSAGDEKKKRRLMIGTAVAVVVVAVIICSINLFAGMVDGDVQYPTVYTKDNQLYMFYNKKPYMLSENLITVKKEESADSGQTTQTSTSKKFVDPKVYKQAVPAEKQLVSVSSDGLYTYFLENVNVNNGRGDLVFYQNDSPKSRTVIASSVYYKIQMSKDGKSVLYLKNTDDTGYHGELCFWSTALKDSISVEQDICSNNFVFAQNGLSLLYIKNFNPIVNTGDLCLGTINKDNIESSVLDEKVAFVFGTTPKNGTYLYAKDYDTKTGTYGLYCRKNNESAKLYAEDAFLPPVLLEKSDAVYAYSNYHENFQTISYINLETGQSNLMAENVTEIERVRIDEGAIIYTKTYETDKSDYYVVDSTANASQKIANAVVTPKNGAVQFDAADDFSRVAYISGYDEEVGQGALFTLSINMGYVGTEKRISDAAYSCDVSSNGATVRFATNYNKDTATVSLVSYVNSNTVTLAEEVSAGAFTYDKSGEAMVYAANVKTDPYVSGDIKCVSTKGKIREIAEGMSSYGLKKDGMILLLQKEEGASNGKLYYSNQKGSKVKLIDEGVSGALLY